MRSNPMRSNSNRFRTLAPAAVCAGLLLVALATAPAASAQNFASYVSIGDSLASGYLSGGLVDDAQERSIPALIARQAGVTQFDMPLVSDPGIPPLLAITGFNGASPVIVPRSGTPGAPLNLNLPRPYDNLAVPGFRVHDVVATVTGNALIDIILRGQGTALQQAAVQRPTFATVWIGNNDVLGAATSGIVIDGVTLTPVASFTQDLRTILATLSAGGAQLAVANLPNVAAIPFVTTIPPVVVNPATGQPVLGPNGQPIPLIGPSGPLGSGDRVLLTASGFLAQGIGIPAQLGGTGQPLPDSAVLSAGEVAAIQARTNAYNAAIAQAASDFGAALVDINAFFEDVRLHGYHAGGNITLTTAFLTGGIFSYDGVHPTPIGYAVAANLFIDAINQRFGGSIPRVDLIPFLFGPDGSAGATIELPGLLEGTPVFSAAAYESLRLSLRTPKTEELMKIKERRERRRSPAPPTGGVSPERPATPSAPALGGERAGGRG